MKIKTDQSQKASKFFMLHYGPPILLLANAWDVVSAKVFEIEGFAAIGTTSAGIAATMGYPDGQHMGLKETIRVIRNLVPRIDLPISADIEAGYSSSTEGVVKTTHEVLDAGAVGINLEDGTGYIDKPLYDKQIMKERIGAIRKMAAHEGIHLFINARTDVFLTPMGNINRKIKESVERANAYIEAGADGIFVPDIEILDKEVIKILVKEIPAPLNIIAGTGKPTIKELEQLGVARVSLGPRVMRAALALVRKIAREIKSNGTYTHMVSEYVPYPEVNNWFKK